MSVNKVIILGNVGNQPDVKHLENGNVVANFNVATSEKYKNKAGETVENTEWHRIVAWGKTAEIIEKFVKKGDQIYICGKLKTRKYTDKDGVEKYVTEIFCDELNLIGRKPAEKQDEKAEPVRNQAEGVEIPDQDLPF